MVVLSVWQNEAAQQWPFSCCCNAWYRQTYGGHVLAEVGDLSGFDTADEILAYAGLSASIYQPEQLTNCDSHMETQGSRYLCCAILNATKYV